MNKKIKMSIVVFRSKLDDGQIMIGGLGNPQGIRIMRITKKWIWFIK